MTYRRNFADFLPASYQLPTFSLPTPYLLLLSFDYIERRWKVGNVDKVGAGKGGERKMKEKRAFISFFQNKCVCLRVKCKALPSVHCEIKL